MPGLLPRFSLFHGRCHLLASVRPPCYHCPCTEPRFSLAACLLIPQVFFLRYPRWAYAAIQSCVKHYRSVQLLRFLRHSIISIALYTIIGLLCSWICAQEEHTRCFDLWGLSRVNTNIARALQTSSESSWPVKAIRQRPRVPLFTILAVAQN